MASYVYIIRQDRLEPWRAVVEPRDSVLIAGLPLSPALPRSIVLLRGGAVATQRSHVFGGKGTSRPVSSSTQVPRQLGLVIYGKISATEASVSGSPFSDLQAAAKR